MTNGHRIENWSLLKVGACRHPEVMARRGGHLCPVDFPALVGLIRHREHGVVLFDTGYHPRFFAATEPFPERLYRWATPVQYNEADGLENQLAQQGLTIGDVRAVVVSHFHGDHVAGLAQFPHARIFCAQKGLAQVRTGGRFARVRRGLLSTLVPETLDFHFFETLPQSALPAQMSPYTKGADLFGDGSLIAVELPGHCAGHWGLWVDAVNPAFFIGDAAWSMSAIRDYAPPPALTTGLLGDTAAYRDTLRSLNLISGNIEIIPSHCAETAHKWVRYGL